MELVKYKTYKIIDRSDNNAILIGVLYGPIDKSYYLFNTRNGSRIVEREDIIAGIEVDDFISVLQQQLETEKKTSSAIRNNLLNPPPDAQEKVLDMLGIQHLLIKKDDIYYDLRVQNHVCINP